jgi:mRNA interferase RelE/StbE
VSYEIEFTRAALKTFDKLPARNQRRVSAALDKLEQNPRPAESRGITGSESLLRVRVGDHRIVYRIEEENIILIVRIGHRREVYRNL